MHSKIMLGATYTDVLTGFTGVAIGHCVYLTDCSQTLLQPKDAKSDERPKSEWFDDQRLEQDTAVAVLKIDNGDTPGCDREAPRR